jgi:hypothetical protein
VITNGRKIVVAAQAAREAPREDRDDERHLRRHEHARHREPACKYLPPRNGVATLTATMRASVTAPDAHEPARVLLRFAVGLPVEPAGA